MAKPKSICSVSDCGKVHYGRGFCQSHWERWRKHGDPKSGRINNLAARNWLEEAIKTEVDECLNWPFASNRGGYGVIRIDGKTAIVSEIVCSRVHGPDLSGTLDAAHSCNNRICANKAHISWKTRTDNMADAIEADTWHHGESVKWSVLKEGDVRQIRALLGAMKHKEIAALFGVKRETITAISIGRSWAWLS